MSTAVTVSEVIKQLREKAADFTNAAEVLSSLNVPLVTSSDGAGQTQAKQTRKVSASTRARMKAAQQARWKQARAGKLKIVAKKGA